MTTTTTTQAKVALSLPQKTAIGLLSSLPTANPTLQAIQRTLPLLPPSLLSNLPNLGNSLSSTKATTLATGTGAQNPNNSNTSNMSQSNTCENCHLHPKWFDPASGVLHDYCSRACAKANAATANCEVLYSYTSSQPPER
ncbi:hypothetical protein BDM02DRAFT_2061903 [Thelephora ganbajun]|uniref:Uncharacterized protein n=1 Tax=Thelephora ganbajun TaxID=370292 RepID=A0ACB6ZH25_THEGA|nr:hypothetical protein BDM02DRAFT_2061903 [Thelephora ganbajun]